jgi:hypothetical protein
MKPYVFWVMFTDPVLTTFEDSDEPETFVYLCIIVAESPDKALEWGNMLAHQLVTEGEAKSIEETWIEDMLPDVLTANGPYSTNWLTISDEQRRCLSFVTASTTDRQKTLNAAIQSGDGQMAQKIWQHYLQEHKPEYAASACQLGLPPIVRDGQYVDWSDE